MTLPVIAAVAIAVVTAATVLCIVDGEVLAILSITLGINVELASPVKTLNVALGIDVVVGSG